MSINFGLRRESKEDEVYSVPGVVNRINGYFLDQAPTNFVEVEPGIEYPEGYIPSVQVEPLVAETTTEAIEEGPSPKVRDNGLGIMIIDYPETDLNVSIIQLEPETTPEFSSERVDYKMPIAYKEMAASGLKRFIKTAKNVRSVVAHKYHAANIIMADTVNGIHSVGEKLSKLESKTNRNKVIKGLGGLALVGVAVYASHKGISMLETSHNHHSAHEAAQQLIPAKVPQHHEATQAAVPALPKTVRHAEVVSAAPAHPKAPVHNLSSHHTKTLGSHVSNKLAHYNLKDWTWNLAHRVRPGHENSVITKALRSYQHITGNHAQLVQHGNTSVIEVNNHVVNSSQMEAINRLVVGG
jgi:hypothetical protein